MALWRRSRGLSAPRLDEVIAAQRMLIYDANQRCAQKLFRQVGKPDDFYGEFCELDVVLECVKPERVDISGTVRVRWNRHLLGSIRYSQAQDAIGRIRTFGEDGMATTKAYAYRYSPAERLEAPAGVIPEWGFYAIV